MPLLKKKTDSFFHFTFHVLINANFVLFWSADVPLLLGLYVSSMSSCLAAMYGTPRVLQSIANANVIPGIQFLGNGVSTSSEHFYPKVIHDQILQYNFFDVFFVARSQ